MQRRPSLRVHVPPVPNRQLVPVPRLHRRRDRAQEAPDAAQRAANDRYGQTNLSFVPPLRVAERGTGGEGTSRNPSASTCTTSRRLNSGGGSVPLRNMSRTLLPDRMT